MWSIFRSASTEARSAERAKSRLSFMEFRAEKTTITDIRHGKRRLQERDEFRNLGANKTLRYPFPLSVPPEKSTFGAVRASSLISKYSAFSTPAKLAYKRPSSRRVNVLSNLTVSL